MTIVKVGVVGAGHMGGGIAQVTAQAGISTVLVKARGGELEPLRERMEGRLAKAVESGKLEPEVRDTVLANLSFSGSLGDLKGCGLVIESIVDFLGMSMDQTHTTVERYANTAAASIAVTLDEAVRLGKIKKGDVVGLLGFGGGLAWAANILRWAV